MLCLGSGPGPKCKQDISSDIPDAADNPHTPDTPNIPDTPDTSNTTDTPDVLIGAGVSKFSKMVIARNLPIP